MENPIKIDRVEKGATKDGTAVIRLFTEPLEYATLTLFQSQFGLLYDVGIDPNHILEAGRPYYTNFLAHWKVATNGGGEPKLNGEGNPYKLADRLEGRETADPALAELRKISAMLEFLINQTAPTEETAGLFSYTYKDGSAAEKPEERAAFDDYRRANSEEAPASVDVLRDWVKGKGA